MSLLYLSILIGAIVGLARGGQIRYLAALRVRFPWALAAAVAMQLPWIYAPPVPPGQGIDPLRLWLPVAYVPVFAFALGNHRLPGIRLLLVGCAANAAVIVANGGLMPTHEAALERAGMGIYSISSRDHLGTRLPRSKDIVLSREETRLWWLSDILVSPPIPRRTVMSVGDLFVATGLALLAAQAACGKCAVLPQECAAPPNQNTAPNETEGKSNDDRCGSRREFLSPCAGTRYTELLDSASATNTIRTTITRAVPPA